MTSNAMMMVRDWKKTQSGRGSTVQSTNRFGAEAGRNVSDIQATGCTVYTGKCSRISTEVGTLFFFVKLRIASAIRTITLR